MMSCLSLNRRIFLILVSILAVYFQPCLGLNREYCGVPYLCPVDAIGFYTNVSVDPADIRLIPRSRQRCEQVFCHECNDVWWQTWNVSNDIQCPYYWNCLCKRDQQYEEETEDYWNADWDTWTQCPYGAIYPGYLDPSYQAHHFLFLDYLAYVKSNLECKCYWPEVSGQAASISDTAYKLIRNLLENTALCVLVDDDLEQAKFLCGERDVRLNVHGMTIELVVHCFFFSHYDLVLDDLEEYSRRKFDSEVRVQVSRRIDEVRERLSRLFLPLYEQCFSKHANSRIQNELEYLRDRLPCNYDEEDLRTLSPLCTDSIDACFNCESSHSHSDYNDGPMSAQPGASILSMEIEASNTQRPTTHHRGKGPVVDVRFYLNRGIRLSEELQYKAAIVEFNQAIEIDPTSLIAYQERAIAYFELGDIDAALVDYRKARKLQDGDTLLPLGMAFGNVLEDDTLQPLGIISNYSDYYRGFCMGTLEGCAVSANEFVPSTMSTLRGLGMGLWAFIGDPISSSQDFIEVADDMIQLLSLSSPELLQVMVPELRELSEKWFHITHYEKGHRIGFVIGKYGLDIFGGAGSIGLLSKFRQLKRANLMCTLESCEKSALAQRTILVEAAKRITIREQVMKNGYLKIHWGRQNKHIPGKPNYLPDRSILSHKNPQALVDGWAGTGTRFRCQCTPGVPGYVEMVDFGEIIGYSINRNTGFQTASRWGTIHYAKDGVHIVPRFPPGS